MSDWYDTFVANMIQQREDRGWTRTRAAAVIGVSHQKLHHWEVQRNRAKPADITQWAGAYGLVLSISWRPAENPPSHDEFISVLDQMSDSEKAVILRFMQVYKHADSRARHYLEGSISVEERAGTDDTSSPDAAKAHRHT